MNVRNNRAQVGQGPPAIMFQSCADFCTVINWADPRKRMPPTPQGMASAEIMMRFFDRRSQVERAGEFTGPLVEEHEPPRDVVLPPFRLILADAAHPARLESPMAFLNL